MTRLIGRLIVRASLDFAEQLAGRLLSEAAKRRQARGNEDDWHESRHLFAAILAGNSEPCGDTCHLSASTMTALYDGNFEQ